MSNLVVIHGTSGSGKSSVLDALADLSNEWTPDNPTPEYIPVHPIDDLKQFLKGHYQCPDLDTVEGKEYCPPGANFGSMQNLMVEYWKWMKDLDPLFSCRYLEQRLNQLYEYEYDVCTCAIRNLPEVDVLAESKFKNKLWINIKRPQGEKPEVSDEGVDEIFLKAYRTGEFLCINMFNNYNSVEEWKEQSVQIILETLEVL